MNAVSLLTTKGHTSSPPHLFPPVPYDSYEDYLDKQITPTDLYYLEDVELARQLVELG